MFFRNKYPGLSYVEDVHYVYDGQVGTSAGSAAIDFSRRALTDSKIILRGPVDFAQFRAQENNATSQTTAVVSAAASSLGAHDPLTARLPGLRQRRISPFD